jgi:uncharacterized protein (DUF305 family)
MRIRHACRAVVVLVAALTLAACGSTSDMQTQTSDKDAGDEQSRLERLYWARQDSAQAAFTEADVRFMTGMIKHHAQAVVMSRLAPTHASSEQVKTLAARIINAQQDEIDLMQRWLQRRDQPSPEINIDGTRLTADGESIHGMNMAGVLTEKQIRELDAARGTTFDRLFLKYMIEHHSGALTMVDTLFGTDGAAQGDGTYRLASDIHAAQKTEIARMKQMLDDLPDPE